MVNDAIFLETPACALQKGAASRFVLPVLGQRRSDTRSDYVIVCLTQQLPSRRPDMTVSVFGPVIW